MTLLEWAIEHSDKLGSVSVLLIVIASLAYIVKFLYGQNSSCEKARLEDANERAKITRDLGELTGKVETMQALHEQHLVNIIRSRSEDD